MILRLVVVLAIFAVTVANAMLRKSEFDQHLRSLELNYKEEEYDHR
jgi:hypothetical protein